LNDKTKTQSRYDNNSVTMEGRMKPSLAPSVPGSTEAERMSNALKAVLTVSKKDLLKAEAREQRAKERKKRAKQTT
jgi:hypothetical protein